ncbi:MAG: DUF4345 family protein [Spongiibacteraceae bacterium]|jgi:hypothetical protein|nr:DUF4345 family protein [Spongiibacteraceae bacterium]
MNAFARAFLVVNGLLLAGYGIWCFSNPLVLQEYARLVQNTASAMVEVRAMYGGLQLMVGLLLLSCGLHVAYARMGLAVSAVCFLGLAPARLAGVLQWGLDDYNLGALIYETVCVVLSLLFLARWKAAAHP